MRSRKQADTPMHRGRRVGCVIPAFNEKESVGLVVSGLLSLEGDDGAALMDDIVVCDNASADGTGEVAARAGARVVRESRQGYGSACLAAIAALEYVDVVLFVDADLSDLPEDAFALLDAIDHGADLAIGSRVLGHAEKGALTPQQRFGNQLAAFLIRLIWKHDTTDLGPFRAIRRESLERIGMADPDFGWTVEMQVKALRHGMKVVEVPVTYRRRIGKSKISGTVRGTILAGYKILTTIGLLAIRKNPDR